MSFPAPKSSAQHCQEVVETAGRLYSKRAKYNKDFDEITKKGINIAAEQVNIDAEREAIEKSLKALEKRKEELDKAVEAHKKREQESQALLKDIEEDMSRMNQDITNAFLD
jgi:DNA repair ATPase RecN